MFTTIGKTFNKTMKEAAQRGHIHEFNDSGDVHVECACGTRMPGVLVRFAVRDGNKYTGSKHSTKIVANERHLLQVIDHGVWTSIERSADLDVLKRRAAVRCAGKTWRIVPESSTQRRRYS